MKKIVVLGAGNIGKFIGESLSASGVYDVTIVDINDTLLKTIKGKTFHADLSSPYEIQKALELHDADIVINALPSFLGFQALKISVKLKRHVVDFSYMTEDPRQLDALAKENGVTVVTDFGFAPGMCHMFVGRALKLLGKGISSIIYVGGLPIKEEDEYKVVFSARDVLEEYSRPARILKEGKIETVTPFDRNYSYEKLLDGLDLNLNLSGFISDGLRTMLDLDGVENLLESTLRYHKHFDKMVTLKEDGFFKPENIEHTEKVLAEKWKRGPKDRDMSILDVRSTRGNSSVEHFLYDEYDEKLGHHSMARVTGSPVIAATELIATGKLNKPGVNLPEILGQDDEFFNLICGILRAQGITLTEKVTTLVGVE